MSLDLVTPTTAPARRRTSVLLCAALLVQLAATLVLVDPDRWGLRIRDPYLWLPLTALPYAAAVVALARSGGSQRRVATVVLAATALLQLAALSAPPQTSNDDLRYLWDAKVQLAGVDPYRYVPDDPALARLHDPSLFTDTGCALPTGCALLNRPTVHTIYPPVAQVVFDAIRLASFGGRGGYGGQRAFQLAAALGVLAVTVLLLRRSRRTGAPPWHAALWGWCPIVVSEYGSNAHIDWVAILLCVVALGVYVRGRPGWAGALLGAAIATKLYPAVLGASMLRRRPGLVAAAASGVFALGYVPHVAAVGADVVGYLPGYLNEEGYSSGSRLLLVGRLVPHPFDTVAGALVLAVLAWRCIQVSDRDHPERSAVWLVGAAFLVATPNYGWYAGLLVVLVALTGRWHWLPVAFAPTCTYLYGHSGGIDSLIYLAAAVLSLACWAGERAWLSAGRGGAGATDQADAVPPSARSTAPSA